MINPSTLCSVLDQEKLGLLFLAKNDPESVIGISINNDILGVIGEIFLSINAFFVLKGVNYNRHRKFICKEAGDVKISTREWKKTIYFRWKMSTNHEVSERLKTALFPGCMSYDHYYEELKLSSYYNKIRVSVKIGENAQLRIDSIALSKAFSSQPKELHSIFKIQIALGLQQHLQK